MQACEQALGAGVLLQAQPSHSRAAANLTAFCILHTWPLTAFAELHADVSSL